MKNQDERIDERINERIEEGYSLPISNIERHYRQKELEQLFNISASAIRNLVKQGKLRRKKFGRTNLYAESDILNCLNAS